MVSLSSHDCLSATRKSDPPGVSQFRFLDLPPEIRLMVYEYAVYQEPHKGAPGLPALLRSSLQITREIYRVCHFVTTIQLGGTGEPKDHQKDIEQVDKALKRAQALYATHGMPGIQRLSLRFSAKCAYKVVDKDHGKRICAVRRVTPMCQYEILCPSCHKLRVMQYQVRKGVLGSRENKGMNLGTQPKIDEGRTSGYSLVTVYNRQREHLRYMFPGDETDSHIA